MVIKLRVTSREDAQWSHEQIFDQVEVSIGRDLKSDLKLRDSKKIVSRHHAVIEQAGDKFTVTDLNSQNFTYLNDKKLEPSLASPLKDGDNIKIGEFDIAFAVEEIQLEHLEKTLFSAEHPNPFTDDLQLLAETLTRICHTYEKEGFARKKQALKETIENVFDGIPVNDALEIMAGVIKNTMAPLSSAEQENEPGLSIDEKNSSTKKVVLVLMELLAKLVQARKEFRLEFLGETIVGSAGKFSIQDCTDRELVNYYLSPDVPPEEAEKRIKSLKTLADELKVHQLSLLEGYKAGVSQGSMKLIKKFDPAALKSQMGGMSLKVAGLKIPLSFLPVIKQIKLKQRMSDSFFELSKEDLSILEKEYFRSGYIQGYYRRMDQLKQKNPKS